MDKLTKENIIKLAKDLSINLNEDDIKYILSAAPSYEAHVKAIKDFKIDKDVKVMDYPYERTTTYLRDDEEIHNLTKEEVLFIAPKSDNDYVLIDRVIK